MSDWTFSDIEDAADAADATGHISAAGDPLGDAVRALLADHDRMEAALRRIAELAEAATSEFEQVGARTHARLTRSTGEAARAALGAGS